MPSRLLTTRRTRLPDHAGYPSHHLRLPAPTERVAMHPESEFPPVVASNREDFAELSRRVRDGGLMAHRDHYYAVKIGATTGALGALVGAAVILGNSWWNLAVAGGLAFILVQLGFIGHDAYTNRPDKDPDLAPGALVYTPAQVGARGRFGRWFARIQALFLVPLLFLEALNLHLASIVSLARRRDRAAPVESGLLAVHGGIFFGAPFLILSPARAVVFIAITQSLFGFYLGTSFVTNHVGMPTLSGNDNLGFLRRQVLTSRNLSGRRLTGFIFGGLDSQIEHHLFPTMPRANLRRARKLVRPFCTEHRIAYTEQSPWRAYRDVLHHLHAVGTGRATPAIG